MKVDLILDQLFTNNTIDRSKFPKFHEGRRVKKNERDISFFLNANYDFKNRIWKSGFFKIQDEDWESLGIIDGAGYKYPILGDGFSKKFEFSKLRNFLETDALQYRGYHIRLYHFIIG